jgi:hypothetical protein
MIFKVRIWGLNRFLVILKPAIFTLLLLLSNLLLAQDKKLVYQVFRNGTQIGNLVLQETKTGEKTHFKLHSEITTRVIFKISAKGTEEAEFEKGVLRNSSFTQTVNGKEKVNKQTSHKGTHYIVSNNGKETRISQASIAYNMICLYTMEPLNRLKIYSDKFSSFLSITKIKDHHYKIKFPDGNYNEYIYENGICKSIVVESSLYSVTMELKN